MRPPGRESCSEAVREKYRIHAAEASAHTRDIAWPCRATATGRRGISFLLGPLAGSGRSDREGSSHRCPKRAYALARHGSREAISPRLRGKSMADAFHG